MSEYWKSTPKYWCKDCKVFVRDTKFERTQHEATGKHQGNIRRAINELHRNVAKEEREKQRTKDEIERLNRVVSGTGTTSKSSDTNSNGKQAVAKTGIAVATQEERKRQLAQLAALGVQVPEGFRKENAMIGEWETVAINPVYDDNDNSQSKSGSGSKDDNSRDRKRTFDGEDDDTAEHASKKAWRPALKKYEYKKTDDDDIETLLGGIKTTPSSHGQEDNIKQEESTVDGLILKKEELNEGENSVSGIAQVHKDADIKQETVIKAEESLPSAGIVFKKRKGKPKS